MQIDIGFGDVIVPSPIEIHHATLLEFPSPILAAYPKETVVAEKLEALTALGLLNSRLKDYCDLALFSRVFLFDGQVLVNAVRARFMHRGTNIEADPVGFTDAFSSDPARAVQWRAFLRRSRIDENPGGFHAVVSQVRGFAEPVLSAAQSDGPFSAVWRPGGPWE